jgi:hypothetical protein
VAIDYYNNYVNDRITYRDIKLSPRGKKTETGDESRGSNGYYVDSFAIMNVSVKGGSTSSNNSITPNSNLQILQTFIDPNGRKVVVLNDGHYGVLRLDEKTVDVYDANGKLVFYFILKSDGKQDYYTPDGKFLF